MNLKDFLVSIGIMSEPKPKPSPKKKKEAKK